MSKWDKSLEVRGPVLCIPYVIPDLGQEELTGQSCLSLAPCPKKSSKAGRMGIQLGPLKAQEMRLEAADLCGDVTGTRQDTFQSSRP